MVAQLAEPQPSASQQLGNGQVEPCPEPDTTLASAKTLICALNFISRNLPLPQHVYDAVSSIYQDTSAESGHQVAADELDFDVDGNSSKGAASPSRTVSEFVCELI